MTETNGAVKFSNQVCAHIFNSPTVLIGHWAHKLLFIVWVQIIEKCVTSSRQNFHVWTENGLPVRKTDV